MTDTYLRIEGKQQHHLFAQDQMINDLGDSATFTQFVENDSYDVVVVLTGLNDLKGILLPFLTTGVGRNDTNFKEGLRQMFFLLKEKLKWKVERMKKDCRRAKVENEENTPSDNKTCVKTEKGVQPKQLLAPQNRPLMVIPALPTLPIPLFQYPPIGWFAHALFECLDAEKRALSNEHPDAILFVDAPSPNLIQNIEKGTSEMCSHRKTERVLLALSDVKQSAKRKIEILMREHSLMFSAQGEDKECETEKSCEEAFHSNLMKKMPDFLGSKLVSVDKIHPNDDGYDYWGRHIAAAIVDEWKNAQKHDVSLR